MKAVLIPGPPRVTVELRDSRTGARFGVHWFRTMDEALGWMKRMKMDYVMGVPRRAAG